MSAFVVSHDHIDALLTFVSMNKSRRDGVNWGVGTDSVVRLDLTDLGRILLRENERSVAARYRDHKAHDHGDYTFRTFTPFVHMAPGKLAAWILKACSCFDYQACETDDYKTTTAHTIIECIRDSAIASLPGYEEAPWGIDRALRDHARV